MWQERGDMEPADRASRVAPWCEGWRGSVQHVPSGERAYFIQLSDMNEFVRSQLARARE